jgi:cell division protein FtsW
MRAGYGIILVALALLTLGVVMVNSAGLMVTPDPRLVTTGQVSAEEFERLSAAHRPISPATVFFGRTTMLALAALAALFIGSRIPVERLGGLRGWRSPVPWVIGSSILLLVLVHVPGIGRSVNSSARWIGPPQYGFQPSELAKWAMPFVVAWWCCRQGNLMASFGRGFLPAIAVLAVVCGLVAGEDLGTAVLIFAAGCLVLFAGGVRWWNLALLVPAGLAAVAALIVTSPYRLDRLLAWRNPFADPQGIGYHIIQSMSAISGGGLTGRGFGRGLQKYGYLPEDTTDFIYAIVCEELGIGGALLPLVLYAVLLWFGYRILSMRVRTATGSGPALSPFAQLYVFGVLATVGLQALINVTVVTGIAPTKGIALPLLSSGGSGWVLTGFALGTVLAIERTAVRRVAREGQPDADDGVVAAAAPA